MRLSGIQRGVAYPARRDTYPAACHDFSKTQEDSRGLQGNERGNKLTRKLLPRPELTTKVARRRCFSKRAGSGSIPAASTSNLGLFNGLSCSLPPPPLCLQGLRCVSLPLTWRRLFQELYRRLDRCGAQMHVSLSSGEVFVPRKLLDRAGWRASHGEMRTEGVAQRVEVYPIAPIVYSLVESQIIDHPIIDCVHIVLLATVVLRPQQISHFLALTALPQDRLDGSSYPWSALLPCVNQRGIMTLL